mmetsp:Transcript_26740/g.43757  ORF Transcript_26740/g.43757 Transcript_26740/m.43757 type:complete len:220 (-) Transcript_26740:757-1416(-)
MLAQNRLRRLIRQLRQMFLHLGRIAIEMIVILVASLIVVVNGASASTTTTTIVTTTLHDRHGHRIHIHRDGKVVLRSRTQHMAIRGGVFRVCALYALLLALVARRHIVVKLLIGAQLIVVLVLHHHTARVRVVHVANLSHQRSHRRVRLMLRRARRMKGVRLFRAFGRHRILVWLHSWVLMMRRLLMLIRRWILLRHLLLHHLHLRLHLLITSRRRRCC